MANLSNINNKFIVEDSGDVGIGVTSATTKLHIGGTAPGDSIIRQDSTVSGTNWEIGERAAGKWQIFEDDGDTIVTTFMSTGNVGIGTDSPDAKLDILGKTLNLGGDNGSWTARTSGVVKTGFITSPHYVNAEEDIMGMIMIGNTTENEISIGGGTSSYNAATKISFFTATNSSTVTGTQTMLIYGTGNVGIGTGSAIPKARLEVAASVNGNPVTSGSTQTNGALRVRGSATNVLDIGQQSASPYAMWMQVCESTSLGVSYPLVINPNGGNVGIGTAAPGAKLEIFGGGNTLRMDSAGDTAKTFLMRNVNTAIAEIKTDGNLDINIEDAGRTMRFLNGNAERMRINSQGQMWLGGSYTGSNIANGNTAYMNNLNAGSFSILHRNSSDVYVHFNSYYTNSNTYVSKYSGRGFMLGYNASVDNGFFFSKAPNTTAGQNQTFSQVMTVGYGTSNNVGIGTTSPTNGKFVINQNSSAASFGGNVCQLFENFNTTDGQMMSIGFRNNNSVGTTAYIDAVAYDQSIGATDIRFSTYSGSAWSSNMVTFQHTGRVGIGTTSPDFALDIEAVDSGVQLQMGRTNTNVGSAWMGASGSGLAVGVGAYGSGNSVTDPRGFLIDASGNLSTRRRIVAKTDTGVGVGVTRNLFVAYGGSSYDYTFDPVALFGANKSGGKLLLEVTGWPERLNCGYIVWRNDGGGSSLIGTGVVSYVQTAVQNVGNVAVSLPSSNTNEIKISFTGWHTNSHGWSCYIKNDF